MAVEQTTTDSTSPEHRRNDSRGIITSPRISFSHDLSQFEDVPVESHLPLSPSSLSASASFNFNSFPNHSSPADDLFSNGFLLPFQNPKSPLPPPPPPITPSISPPPPQDPKTNKPPPPPIPPQSTSFWKFGRSRSCNCGGIYSGTLCPLLLPRSKSTGSNSSSSKRSLISRDEHPQHRRARNVGGGGGGYQKPPLNKGYGGSGVKVSPVLNVSSGNMFGLGSIFRSIGRAGEKGHKKKLVI